jgi:hypothetical protein
MLSVTKSDKTGKWPTNHLQGHIKPSEHINEQFARWEARERGGWQYLARDRREFITLLGGAVSWLDRTGRTAARRALVPPVPRRQSRRFFRVAKSALTLASWRLWSVTLRVCVTKQSRSGPTEPQKPCLLAVAVAQ